MTDVLSMDVSKGLLTLSAEKCANYLGERNAQGLSFNIFKLLDRHKNEVKGHSAFLAEFLNPFGAHGQGDIYLNLFLDSLGLADHIQGYTDWRVYAEFGKDVDGRIDLLVTGVDTCGHRVAIAIENKIHAEDQELQLTRYYKFLNANYPASNGADISWFLYYLTLHGDAPSSQSIKGIPRAHCEWLNEREELSGPVRLLSYADDISSWMAQCREKSPCLPYVRESIAQYIDTLETLTGSGGSMPKELAPLLDSFETINAAHKLGKAVDLKKVRIVQDIWDDIKVSWGQSGGCLIGTVQPNIYVNVNGLKETSRSYFKSRRKNSRPTFFGLCCDAYSFDGKDASLEIRFDGYFYVALYGENDTRILPKKAVENFYETMPQGLYAIPNIVKTPIKDHDRTQLKSTIDFNGYSKELLELADEEKRKKFAQELLGMAEYTIKNLGLTPRKKITGKI